MSTFSKRNFKMIINEIEEMESSDENIWVPIGILERMYDDDLGYLDYYFHSKIINRDIDWLWDKINK